MYDGWLFCFLVAWLGMVVWTHMYKRAADKVFVSPSSDLRFFAIDGEFSCFSFVDPLLRASSPLSRDMVAIRKERAEYFQRNTLKFCDDLWSNICSVFQERTLTQPKPIKLQFGIRGCYCYFHGVINSICLKTTWHNKEKKPINV